MTQTARQSIEYALGSWTITADEKANPEQTATEMMQDFERAWPEEFRHGLAAPYALFTHRDLAEYIAAS